MKNKIIVVLRGGLVESVFVNQELSESEVVVLDYDDDMPIADDDLTDQQLLAETEIEEGKVIEIY